MKTLRRGFEAVAMMGLLPCAVSAQWQLPPGTSSSIDDGTRNAAAGDQTELAEAEKQMQAQDWKAAVAALTAFCAKHPKDAHALYDLGFVQEALHDTPAARMAYEQAIAADGKAVLPRVALGLLLARTGETTAAAEVLRQAVALPGSPEVIAAQAHAWRALARTDLADAPDRSRDELLAGIRLSGETPDDVLLSSEIAEALHDDAAAEQALARAVKADPDSVEAARRYARVLARQQKVAEARVALDGALKRHPEDAALLSEQAGLLVQAREFAEALPLLQKLHAADPSNTALSRLLARTLVATGKPGEADNLFQQLHAADPQNGGLTTEWADSLIRQKRNGEAEALLQSALRTNFSTKEGRAYAAEKLAFAASADHHPEIVVQAIAIRNETLPMDAPSAFLLATAHDTLHHTSQSAGYYRQFLDLAGGKFPDEEWQAQQRLLVLRRAK